MEIGNEKPREYLSCIESLEFTKPALSLPKWMGRQAAKDRKGTPFEPARIRLSGTFGSALLSSLATVVNASST